MATAVQVESLWSGLTDNNGQPLAAGKVFTYAAGTTTPVSLFTAADKSTSATNPLILDAYGKAQVWADGRYKFVVKTSADVTLYTLDNLLYGFDDTTVLYGGTSTGSANAQVVSVPATVTSYANGQTISFVAGYTNTGATTLQFNSLSAVSLVKGATPSSLQAGDLIAGQLYTATYHGGAFRLTDYPTVADVQRSRFETATGVAGTNTITANLTPALTGYETGMVVQFVAANANTGATTLNLNGLGAKAVQRQGAALVGGEFKAGDVVSLFYDGTQFQIVNIPSAPLFLDRVNNRVGIGTTAPAEYLSIVAPVGGGTVSNAGISLRGNNVSTANEFFIAQVNDGATTYVYNRANGPLVFGTNNLERVRIDAGGQVGINGTSRSTAIQLDVKGRLAIGSGNTDSELIFTRNSVANSTSWHISLRTDLGGSNEDLKFLRFSSGAFVDIPFQIGASDGGKVLQNGYTYFASSGITSGAGTNALRYDTSSGLVTYDSSSHLVKENIVDCPYGLDAVVALQPRKYFRTDDQKEEIGFVADEVVNVIPETVSFAEKSRFTKNDEDTEMVPSSVAYDRLTSVLCKAIQELNAKVEALESRVAELEA
jgi:hypothetical protein